MKCLGKGQLKIGHKIEGVLLLSLVTQFGLLGMDDCLYNVNDDDGDNYIIIIVIIIISIIINGFQCVLMFISLIYQKSTF